MNIQNNIFIRQNLNNSVKFNSPSFTARVDNPIMEDSFETSKKKKGNSVLEKVNKFLNKAEILQNVQDKIDFNLRKQNLIETIKKSSEEGSKYLAGLNLNKFNIDLVEKIFNENELYQNKNVMSLIPNGVNEIDTKAKAEITEKIIHNKSINQNEYQMHVLNGALKYAKNEEAIKVLDKIYTDENINKNKDFFQFVPIILRDLSNKPVSKLDDLFNLDNINKVEKQRNRIKNRSDLYLNGMYSSQEEADETIDYFYNNHYLELLMLNSILDKDAVDNIMRQRLVNVSTYLNLISSLTNEERDVIKKFNNATTLDDKPFLPNQKTEFGYVVEAVRTDKIQLNKISKELDSGKFDLNKLNLDLLKNLLQQSGMSKNDIENMPKEKLANWDLKYVPLIFKSTQEVNDDSYKEPYYDVLNFATTSNNFKEKITNVNNKYGETNLKTQQLFKKDNMNYDKWLNPNSSNNVHFVYENTEAKKMKNVVNKFNQSRLDYTIKCWERVPQKDLFQGNKSTCCIGMGGDASDAMPIYLLNTAFNMIEVIDNKTNDVVGNSLIYFTKDKKQEPSLILDNIEIKNSLLLSENAGINLRNAIVKYGSNIAQNVTNSQNTKIYMSNDYNDVPTEDLNKKMNYLTFIGKISEPTVYLDLYEGWKYKEELNNKVLCCLFE